MVTNSPLQFLANVDVDDDDDDNGDHDDVDDDDGNLSGRRSGMAN